MGFYSGNGVKTSLSIQAILDGDTDIVKVGGPNVSQFGWTTNDLTSVKDILTYVKTAIEAAEIAQNAAESAAADRDRIEQLDGDYQVKLQDIDTKYETIVDLSVEIAAGNAASLAQVSAQAKIEVDKLLGIPDGATQLGTSNGSNVQAELDGLRGDVTEIMESGTGGAEALATALSNPTGSGMIGFKRKKLSEYIDTAQKYLDSNGVSIWEYASLVTNKPTADPQTWDWSPALQAMADYCVSYVAQTGVNATMFGSKDAFLTPGVFPLYSQVNVTKQGNSNGSLQTVFNLRGAGRTSSILQPMSPGMTGLLATNCSVVFSDLGMRAGSTDQVGIQLGYQAVWAPVAHAIFNRFGTSGFVTGCLSYLCFDSSFNDCFWQNIAAQSTLGGSYGVRFATYAGPQNGGTAGDGSGDGTNQIIFVRPTIETASDDSVMLSIEGKNGAYPTHSLTVIGGHLESHNLKTKLFHIRNARYVSFRDVTISQNGSSAGISSMYRLGFIENCQNVLFDHCHMTTTNRLAAYASTDTASIKVNGTCQNLSFRDCHFLGPYQDINSAKHRLDYIIDYSESKLLKKAFDATGSVCGDNQSREITTRIRVGSLSGIHDYRFDVDETSGNVSMYYSTNITDVPDGTAVWQVTPAGVIKTAQNIQVGALGASATRNIDFVNNGDGTTAVASIRSDNVGRLYFNSLSNAQSWVMGSVAFNPVTTGVYTLGTSLLYPSNIYSQNALTIVSDANYKSLIKPISPEVEYNKLVAAVGSVPYSAWKLKTAIAQKGVDNARWHVGVIAQQVRDAILAAGLDWTKYGLITFESHKQVVTKTSGKYYPVLKKGEVSEIPTNASGSIDLIEGADTIVTSGGVITYTREIYMLRMEEFFTLRLAYIESKM